jgi:palmitoyltransferase
MAARGQKTTNIWVARIIPVLLIGIIGYSAYVITKVIALDYLINPPPDFLVKPRPGSAAAILLFYYLLLIPLLVCYARLIQTIITNPGYVPRGAAWYQQHKEKAASSGRHSSGHHSRRVSTPHLTEKPLHSWQGGTQDLESGGSNHSSLTTAKNHAKQTYNHSHSPGIPFWQRDIFVCNPDGRPAFCSSCLTHKPDRTHHCSEVDRCVLKMDHFCPWVGGIVSETSFKAFIQFLVYAALFCVMVLTTISVFIAERRRIDRGFLDVHYFLLLGLSALFLLFSLGMAGSSIQLSLINSTTIENLNRRSKVWFLAILIPRGKDGTLPPPPPPSMGRQGGVTAPRFQTITYPRPVEEEQFLIEQAQGQGRGQSNLPLPITNPAIAPSSTATSPRTFAIVSTQPGENPFDIGPRANICEVMGYSLSEWLFPIKPSPCADHRGRVSAFRMNEGLVRRLQEENGLIETRRCKRSRGSRESENESGVGSRSEDGSGMENYGSRSRKKGRDEKARQTDHEHPAWPVCVIHRAAASSTSRVLTTQSAMGFILLSPSFIHTPESDTSLLSYTIYWGRRILDTLDIAKALNESSGFGLGFLFCLKFACLGRVQVRVAGFMHNSLTRS